MTCARGSTDLLKDLEDLTQPLEQRENQLNTLLSDSEEKYKPIAGNNEATLKDIVDFIYSVLGGYSKSYEELIIESNLEI